MVEALVPLPAMAVIGLLGAGHCAGMCGGIAGALGLASDGKVGVRVLMYNLGRVLSYGLIGALVALLGGLGADYLSLGPALRFGAGLLMIAMGLYLGDWWRGLVVLERAGARLWKRVQPLSRCLLPISGPISALGLGMLWGWLPCGLVYSAVAYAAAAPTPAWGALIMLAFGLGTLPAMLVGGWASGRVAAVLRARRWRRLFGLLMMAYGFWTLALAMGLVAGGDSPMHHY